MLNIFCPHLLSRCNDSNLFCLQKHCNFSIFFVRIIYKTNVHKVISLGREFNPLQQNHWLSLYSNTLSAAVKARPMISEKKKFPTTPEKKENSVH